MSKDSYQIEADRLQKIAETDPSQFKKEVFNSWINPEEYGNLFAFCAQDPENHYYGCLTQVKIGLSKAQTPELTAQILADPRIPCGYKSIQPQDLPVFVEWQRRLDVELNRKVSEQGEK